MVVHSEKVTEEHKGRDCDDDGMLTGVVYFRHQMRGDLLMVM